MAGELSCVSPLVPRKGKYGLVGEWVSKNPSRLTASMLDKERGIAPIMVFPSLQLICTDT